MPHSPSNSEQARRAERVIPAGVNSINRRIGFDLVLKSAQGAYFTDIEDRRFLDYHAAFGPLILGHNHPAVNAAVKSAMDRIDIIGVGVTDLEITLAEKIVQHVPSAERVLLTNSGSEATFAALRLARAATGRSRIIKFQGTYHGWHDAVLLNVISAPDKIGKHDPLSAGMMREVYEKTLVLPFNDIEAVGDALEQPDHDIAAILVEIIPHNMGCVLPRPDFLQGLRALTRRHGVVLIFDEVITGFRHGLGGYQKIAGVTPDLSTFAKAMANGYPIAALAGSAALMDRFGVGGGVMFAGTYNGHPVGVAASLATIEMLEAGDGALHKQCFALAQQAGDGIQQIADELGIPMNVRRFGSVFVPYFMTGKTENYTDLLQNDTRRDVWFRQSMCERGIFMLPVAMKRNHVSSAHTQSDIDRTLETARAVLQAMPIAMPM